MNIEQLIEAAKVDVAQKGEAAMDEVRELVLKMFMERQPVMLLQADGTRKQEGFRYLPSNWRTLETCGIFLHYRAMADAILSILKESLADKQLVIEAMQANLDLRAEEVERLGRVANGYQGQAEIWEERAKEWCAKYNEVAPPDANAGMEDFVNPTPTAPKNTTCPSCDAVEIDHGNCIEWQPFCDGSCKTYAERCRANFSSEAPKFDNIVNYAGVMGIPPSAQKALCEAPPVYPNFPCVQKPVIVPEVGEEQTEIRFKDGSVLRLAERVSDAARAALLAMGATVRVRRPKEVE